MLNWTIPYGHTGGLNNNYNKKHSRMYGSAYIQCHKYAICNEKPHLPPREQTTASNLLSRRSLYISTAKQLQPGVGNDIAGRHGHCKCARWCQYPLYTPSSTKPCPGGQRKELKNSGKDRSTSTTQLSLDTQLSIAADCHQMPSQ